ncbi:ATP-binding cassette domain-containing protein [Streptomyces sp. NPDC090445]|uniref:ATP-binding cassette domain-containing protein n=1 Tax=Streptomyces sp. NPDC090445 TaxID=3365963 RepID=UPI00381CABFC
MKPERPVDFSVVVDGPVEKYRDRDRPGVDGPSFAVRRGEVFGSLGPNGAGKTTTTGVLTTRAAPTAGRAFVQGVDVAARPASTPTATAPEPVGGSSAELRPAPIGARSAPRTFFSILWRNVFVASLLMIPMGFLIPDGATWPMDSLPATVGVLLMGAPAGSMVGPTIGTPAPLPPGGPGSIPLRVDLPALTAAILTFGAIGIEGFHRRARD